VNDPGEQKAAESNIQGDGIRSGWVKSVDWIKVVDISWESALYDLTGSQPDASGYSELPHLAKQRDKMLC
jgi:hypothetical protein